MDIISHLQRNRSWYWWTATWVAPGGDEIQTKHIIHLCAHKVLLVCISPIPIHFWLSFTDLHAWVMRHPYLDIMFRDLSNGHPSQLAIPALSHYVPWWTPLPPKTFKDTLIHQNQLRISTHQIYLHFVYYSFLWFTMVHHSLWEFHGIWHIFVNIPCNSLQISTKPTHVLDSVPKLWKVPSCSDLLKGFCAPK